MHKTDLQTESMKMRPKKQIKQANKLTDSGLLINPVYRFGRKTDAQKFHWQSLVFQQS